MSGLIFSVLLGAVTLASLSRTLRDILKFEEVADGHGWRGTVEKDGYLVDVFVKYDKDKAQFILPDASVPEEICKKVVRDLAAKIYAELKGSELPPDSISVLGPSQSFCHYCLKPVRELLFRCKRCGGLYCSRHRFPEAHNCPGSRTSSVRIRVEEREGERKKKRRISRILIKEIPCG